MKIKLNFTDAAIESYCEEIVKEMMRLFSLEAPEAIKRIEARWKHLESIGGDEELIYHETEEHWANDIYYGHDSFWWLPNEKRKSMNLPPLKAVDLNV